MSKKSKSDQAPNKVFEEQVQDIIQNRHGQIPGTIATQNIGYNSKKEGLGPNGKRYK